MENKRICIIFAMLIVSAIVFQSVNAATIPEYGYQIEVADTSFLPETIYPGDTIILEVEIKNKSSETKLTNIEAELSLGEEFKEIKESDTINEIGAGNTKTLAFEFQTKVTTKAGHYSTPLTITYLSESDLLRQTQIVFVPVSETEKNLDITIEPNVVNPGKPTDVVFTIKNVGGTPVSNISLSWTEENNLVLPLGSDNTKYVNVLAANQETNVSYLIAADPNITPGVYPLNISMTFNDFDETKTQTSHIGLIIGGTTEFETSAESLSNGQISISIANVGSNNAGAVVLRIPNQTGVTVSGSSASILGNLNKGDFTLANFEMRITSNQERQMGTKPSMKNNVPVQSDTKGTLLIEVEYTDTTGQRQIIQKELELNTVFSENETTSGFAGKTGKRTSDQNQYIAWSLLAVMIAGAVVYNKFKTGNKKWKKLGKILAIIAILFLAAIFLLGSNLMAIIAVAVISIMLLGWFFQQKHTIMFLRKAQLFIKKQME